MQWAALIGQPTYVSQRKRRHMLNSPAKPLRYARKGTAKSKITKNQLILFPK